MGTRLVTFAILLAASCGEPLMSHVPQPPTGAAAGAAGAVAAAATLADPEAAAKKAEKAKQKQDEAGAPPSQGVRVQETVPADVFDRLDRAKAADRAGEAAPVPGH
jgi:hypothetical protein